MFAKKAHDVLDWLTDAERHLRYQGALAETEEGLQQQLDDHQVCLKHLASERIELIFVLERV
jgi:hypothetical protein